MANNKKLVYSTDPRDQAKINQPPKAYLEAIDVAKIVVIFKIEKSGRGGKTVTILEGWPKNTEFLDKTCKELKTKCGVGGKFEIAEKFGVIEIQGDQRIALKKLLESKGIKFKGM